MTDLVFYKIRKDETGLYSTGGTWVRWTKTGKTWNKIGHLKSHLNLHTGCPGTYHGCSVVTCQAVEVESIPVYAILSDVMEKRAEEERKHEERWAEIKRERELEHAREIMAKYDES